MPLLIVIGGILLLFLLIARFKLNAFIAFIIVSLGVGLAEGMELETLVKAIENGIGNTLGFLLIILPPEPAGLRVALPKSKDNLFEQLIRDPLAPHRPARERLCVPR